MKTIYLAGPYSSNNQEGIRYNIAEARHVSSILWQHGYAVLTPHLNSANFEEFDISWQIFMDGYLTFLPLCDIVVMLPRWQDSKGASIENDTAKALGKRIIYWDYNALDLLSKI